MALGWRGQYYRYKDYFLNIVALYKQRRDLRAFLEVILSLSTVIIFVVFALKPTALTIISLYNEIKVKKDTLRVYNAHLESVHFNREEYKYIEDVKEILIQNELKV